MFDSYKSAIITHPATIDEFENVILKDSDAVVIGGCTHLMRYGNQKYPNRLNGTLVATDKLEKANVFRKSNGFVEVGANITLYKLCDMASAYLNPILLEAINKTFALSLQKRITVAGTIVPNGLIYDLSAALIISSCILDVKKKTQDGIVNLKMPIEDYYLLSQDEIKKTYIISLLMPVVDRQEDENSSDGGKYLDFYKTFSSSYYNPKTSIVLCASLCYKNDTIDQNSIAICYADKSVHNLSQTSAIMTDNVASFLNSKSVDNMRKTFMDELSKFFDNDSRNTTSLVLFDKIIEEIQLEVL